MPGIYADHVDSTSSSDDFAIFADSSYTCSDLHICTPYIMNNFRRERWELPRTWCSFYPIPNSLQGIPPVYAAHPHTRTRRQIPPPACRRNPAPPNPMPRAKNAAVSPRQERVPLHVDVRARLAPRRAAGNVKEDSAPRMLRPLGYHIACLIEQNRPCQKSFGQNLALIAGTHAAAQL